MRIGRAVIIPAILALGVAGSTVAGTATALASVHTHQSAASITPLGGPAASPSLYYHS